MTKDLLSVFEPGTEENWLNKITSDLKGKSLESLFWDSEIGPINPIIFDYQDVTSDNFKPKENNSWSIRQRFDAAAIGENEKILLALKGGVNSIEICNLSSKNSNAIFNEVMLDIIHVYIDINTTDPKSIIDTFYHYCSSENISTENLKGGFIYDPIGNVALSGNWLEDENKDLSSIAEILLAAGNFNNFSILNINASTYCNGGANVDTQIAFAIAHANEYLNLFKDDPIILEKIIQKTEFTFGIGTSYFLEIAKLRAFRSLWSIIINQYTSIEDIKTKIHAINANLYYSNKDMYNNLLRATTSGMSAVLGGCHSLSLLPFNSNASNNEFGERISKNIQLLFQEESYFNQVKDTSKGSYYVESLIRTIKKKSWNNFLSIEKTGGFIAALKKGDIQKQIKKELEKKVNDLKEDKRTMMGVNKFINKNDTHIADSELKDRLENVSINAIPQMRLSANYE
jgi:methylmalonyl-CoA mutase